MEFLATRPPAWPGGRESAAGGTDFAFASAVDEHLRFHSGCGAAARCRIPHHESQSRLAGAPGRAPADVVGQLCEDVLPRMKAQWNGCPYCQDRKTASTKVPDPCFRRLLHGFDLLLYGSGKQAKGTIHVVRDITDRRVAEEKYRLLFEQVQEGVFVATPEGRLLDCNDAFVRMLGYSSREELMAINLDTRSLRFARAARCIPPPGGSRTITSAISKSSSPQRRNAYERHGKQLRHPRSQRARSSATRDSCWI